MNTLKWALVGLLSASPCFADQVLKTFPGGSAQELLDKPQYTPEVKEENKSTPIIKLSPQCKNPTGRRVTPEDGESYKSCLDSTQNATTPGQSPAQNSYQLQLPSIGFEGP